MAETWETWAQRLLAVLGRQLSQFRGLLILKCVNSGPKSDFFPFRKTHTILLGKGPPFRRRTEASELGITNSSPEMTPHLKLCPESEHSRGRKREHVTGPLQPLLARQEPPPLPYFLASPAQGDAETPDKSRSQVTLDSRVTRTHVFSSSALQVPHPKRAVEHFRLAGNHVITRDLGSRQADRTTPVPWLRPPSTLHGAWRRGPRRPPPRRACAGGSRGVSRSTPPTSAPALSAPPSPSALSLGGSGGGGGSRSSLAHYIKGRSGRTGRLELQPVAAAAARGAATGGGFPPWRGVGSGQRPLDPKRVVAFFFKGDSRGF